MHKILVEMAVKAGRRRQSKQTGYLHHCYESASVEEHDTIPLFENFCFLLALFRSRTSENVLEGKSLLNKLLKFRVGANFPVYLHEYPACRSNSLGRRLLPALRPLLNEFSAVLSAAEREELERALSSLEASPPLKTPQSPDELAEALAAGTLDLDEVLPLWHPAFHAYLGKCQVQGRGEPAPTLLDLYMGAVYGSFSRRCLEDHLLHTRAALLYPPSMRLPEPAPTSVWAGDTLFFGGPEHLHSLYLFSKRGEVVREDGAIQIRLVEEEPEEIDERLELQLFCNLHPSTRIRINGRPATTFQLGDTIEIETEAGFFQLSSSLAEGEGAFFGQIARANRPGFKRPVGDDPYVAYDWQIAWRTLRRSPSCTLRLALSSTAAALQG